MKYTLEQFEARMVETFAELDALLDVYTKTNRKALNVAADAVSLSVAVESITP